MKYIPEDFQIFSKVVPTIIETEVEMLGLRGTANAGAGEVRINLDNDDDDSEVECTYLHEVLHILLVELGYGELSNDEEFVDRMSKGLHQFLSSSGIWLDEECYVSEDEYEEDTTD